MKSITAPILIVLAIFFYASVSEACNCHGQVLIQRNFQKSDLVIVGEVIKRVETTIWLDTFTAKVIFRNDYLPEHPTGNYDSFKRQNYTITQLDFSVAVKKRYKGQTKRRTVVIRTGYGNGDCGYRFLIGQDYLIYAVKESSIDYDRRRIAYTKKDLREIYRTSTCDRTQIIEAAAEDIKFLTAKK